MKVRLRLHVHAACLFENLPRLLLLVDFPLICDGVWPEATAAAGIRTSVVSQGRLSGTDAGCYSGVNEASVLRWFNVPGEFHDLRVAEKKFKKHSRVSKMH